MHSEEIRQVFSEQGMELPLFLVEKIDDEEYDRDQSWCCGLMAHAKFDGILVQAYCMRGRGMDKLQWLIHRDGSVTELPSQSPDWMWENTPDEPDYAI